MDYLEEQRSELEAIEAIYPDEFILLSEDPIELIISTKSEAYDEETIQGLCCTLKFKFTPKYPEELPEFEVMVQDEEEEEDENIVSNLEPDDITQLKELLIEQANENLGMAMVFTLVSATIEWMNNRWDSIIKDKEEAAERKKREEEEAEHKRFEGTRVSVATFIAWKTEFDEELAAKRRLLGKIKSEKDLDSKKLSGKELFLRDKTLAESDLQFLEGDDADAAPIDESLFEDMEDLGLESDDED